MPDNKTVAPKSGKRTLTVEWPDRKWFQKKKDNFTFNIGDKESLTSWYKKAKTLEKVDFKDETALDELHKIETELVTMILGKKAWRNIWKRAEHNVFSIYQIMQALADMVKTGIDESTEMIRDEKHIN